MKPRTDLVVEKADGELIVLDKDGGQVHQMNESAALIWNGLNCTSSRDSGLPVA